ncbi:hypothetical protein ACFSQ7_40850 [Paenibacillus rhizoplanae]
MKEAVVIARKDEKDESYLCAYVVSGGVFEASGLRAYLKCSLPEYMIPSYFVRLEQFPLTVNGKVDRKGLPAPEESLQNGAEQAMPETELEAKLAKIWQVVLGVPRLSVLDSFLTSGGILSKRWC